MVHKNRLSALRAIKKIHRGGRYAPPPQDLMGAKSPGVLGLRPSSVKTHFSPNHSYDTPQSEHSEI